MSFIAVEGSELVLDLDEGDRSMICFVHKWSYYFSQVFEINFYFLFVELIVDSDFKFLVTE